MKGRMTRGAVKEAFDNLPAGIGFFNRNGIPTLCNLQLHRLCFELTGHDLQMLGDIEKALNGEPVLLSGRIWQFKESDIDCGEPYTQVVASDITEIIGRKKELENSNEEYKAMISNIRTISSNVVAITREEELLTLKMHIHGKVGLCLQQLGRYIVSDDLTKSKAAVVSSLRDVSDILQKEVGNDDEAANPLDAIVRVAKDIGVTVTFYGELPSKSQTSLLLAYAVRECVANTRRHADGDEVFVRLSYGKQTLTAVITNNGNPPKEKITEGGGLSSLRTRIEKSGGQMTVQSLPQFALIVTIPDREEKMSYYV